MRVGKYVSLLGILLLSSFLCHCAVQPHIKTEKAGIEAGVKEKVPLGFGLKISPDGRYALVISGTGSFSLYDLYEGVQVMVGSFAPRKVLGIPCGGGVAFSPDGKFFAVGGEKSITLWDIEKKEETGSFDIEACAGLSFSPDGKYLLAVSPGPDRGLFGPSLPAIISLFNVEKGRKVKDFPTKPYQIYFNAIFSKDGKYVYTSPDFKMWDVRAGKEIKKAKACPTLSFNPQSIATVSPDGRHVITGCTSGDIIVWDANTLHEVKKIKGEQAAWSVDVSPDGRYLLSGGGGKIVIRELSTLKEVKVIDHPSFFEVLHSIDAKFSPDGKRIVSLAGDAVRVWDVDSGKELASFITFQNGEWIALTPSGYYNSSERGDQLYTVKVSGKEYTIEQLREAFYRPDLVKLALAGRVLEHHRSVADIKQPPEVQIVETPIEVQTDEVLVKVKLIDVGGGIGDVRLYLNDTSVILDSARGVKISYLPGDKVIQKTYAVKLLSGENIIKVVAFNADGTMQSKPVLHKVKSTFMTSRKPKMYVLAIGINEYKNPKLELKYAAADAQLFAHTLSEIANPLFDTVKIKILTTREETTKENIKKVLQGYKSINPDDVFVFYVASHGTVDEGEYFLITSNVGSLSTSRLREDALTQVELKELIANIPSTKKMIVIDTCNAGKLGEALQVAMATRGMSEETAIKILSRAVGSTILSASTSLQEAIEGYQGHGLFTYVLTEGMKGKADLDKDGFIKTLEIANYVDSEVPMLAEKIFKRPQYPTATPSGQSFPVGKVKK
ncbi:MAG: caspase family protein [Syntrophales bacterium]|nr:caspase family protein [Syntrophales bacterium]